MRTFNFSRFAGLFNLAIGIAYIAASLGEPFGFRAAGGLLATVLGCIVLSSEKE